MKSNAWLCNSSISLNNLSTEQTSFAASMAILNSASVDMYYNLERLSIEGCWPGDFNKRIGGEDSVSSWLEGCSCIWLKLQRWAAKKNLICRKITKALARIPTHRFFCSTKFLCKLFYYKRQKLVFLRCDLIALIRFVFLVGETHSRFTFLFLRR